MCLLCCFDRMRKGFLLISAVILQVVCHGQKRNHFTIDISKPPPANTGLRYDGAYVYCEGIKWSRSTVLFFYASGIYYDGPMLHNTALASSYDCSTIIGAILKRITNDPWSFGIYSVSNDTLTTQLTQKPINKLQPYTLYERKWLVRNDSLISIPEVTVFNNFPFEKRYETRRHPDDKYFYFPAPIKPDSSLAWLTIKDWYIQAVSNRQK